MDYIQEEFRRQREALAGLLLGRGPAAGGDSEGSEPPVKRADMPVDAPRASAPERARVLPPAERGDEGGEAHPAWDWGLASPSPLRSRSQAEEAGEAAEFQWGEALAAENRRQEKDTPAEETSPPGLAGTGWAAEAGSPAAGGPLSGAAWERTVTEFIQAESGGPGAGAEALSRVFQRDARRYDGGFSLY